MKKNLINLINYMLAEELSGFNSVTEESRKELAAFIGLFSEKVDLLLYKFFFINNKVDNGGAPVLKEILKEIS
ncbi:hypothetical protein PQ478_08685 [Alkalihalophilus pseudofirmus]|uniref:hypothetical protein n=1 Tax=Alkalihalophilus pseudofirmus TaxID=79885 RepID=UPI00259BD974|nr:hypothetical protein [Alkalihalophilus pseudofirmus]WEG18545.1 hypothetical protein PQ478_08685 [Alkalihalophilus pseudofirmus]